MCSAVFLRTLFIGWRSIAPHLLKSGMVWLRHPAEQPLRGEVLSALAKALTSSMEILSAGAGPGNLANVDADLAGETSYGRCRGNIYGGRG